MTRKRGLRWWRRCPRCTGHSKHSPQMYWLLATCSPPDLLFTRYTAVGQIRDSPDVLRATGERARRCVRCPARHGRARRERTLRGDHRIRECCGMLRYPAKVQASAVPSETPTVRREHQPRFDGVRERLDRPAASARRAETTARPSTSRRAEVATAHHRTVVVAVEANESGCRAIVGIECRLETFRETTRCRARVRL